MNIRYQPLALIFAFSIAFINTLPLSKSQEPRKLEKPSTKPQDSTPDFPNVAKALEALKNDAGTWEAEVSFWFRPGAAPIKSHAVVISQMTLNGMYLEQRFDGTFPPEMGSKKWSTISYTGFNETTKQFEATRMASTSSTMIVVRGKATSNTDKGIAMELSGDYMLMGAKATERDVIRHDGPDTCVIESWMSFGGLEEFKGSEMVLSRIAVPKKPDAEPNADMLALGNFSISIAVKDIVASREFYEKLGFRKIGGNDKNFLILQNDASTIGLFQGMFDKNLLTFNPGWDRNAAPLPEFDDVRHIQKVLQGKGLALTTVADEASTGPASITLADPDGNPILIDQHIPKPVK